jgi:mannose-6-phosphate isomerase-like protein (cupin superfamily)
MDPASDGRAWSASSHSSSSSCGWRRLRGYAPAPGALLRIERWNPSEDGPLTEAALRRKCEFDDCSVTRRTYHPGAVLASENVTTDRVEAVISGLLRITIDGASAILAAGDAVFVPRGSMRRVEVVGAMPVVSLEAQLGETSR